MIYLVLGIILFAGPHFFSLLLPTVRDGVRTQFGEKPFKGTYAVVTLLGVILMITGIVQSRSGDMAADWVYLPAEWARHVTALLVLAGFIALASSGLKGRLRLRLANPMSIGVGLWAFGHLLANGKRADVYLFATFLVLAIADIVLSTLRGKRPDYTPRARDDALAVVIGVALYAVFAFGFHPYVLKLPVFG
jgi:uncharacterized membrane protein